MELTMPCEYFEYNEWHTGTLIGYLCSCYYVLPEDEDQGLFPHPITRREDIRFIQEAV